MNKKSIILVVSVWALSVFNIVMANQAAPWGQAKAIQQEYKNQKVVFDLDASTEDKLENIFSRVGYLSKLNGNDPFVNKVVVVIHSDAIPFFSISNFDKYRELMKLAYSQTLNETIEFRMCSASARLRGFTAADIHGFITMVPMADTEIVRLQQEDYAYMR